MAKAPVVGDQAPPFELESTLGPVRLQDFLARGPVLLVFYPGDDTPVCTKQLCDYSDNLDVFSDLAVQVLGINGQSLESHQKFEAAHEFGFPLLSDPGGGTCDAYGARGLFGITKRTLVLIAGDGRVLYSKTDFPMFRRTAAELKRVLAERLRA